MAKTIDINDWVISGAGGVGISYYHKTDPSLLLKMDNREVSEEEVEKGLLTARIVYSLGLPTPEPGEVVFDGERYGQIFRRILDKTSFARLCGEQPEMIPTLAHDYAEVVKRIHSTKGMGTCLHDIKKTYGPMTLANPYRPRPLLDKATRLLESLPDADTCVHGDLHFGNLIKADGKDYLIDISSFSYGHPYFDIAMMAAIHRLSYDSPIIYTELFHNTAEQGERFWQCFIKEYFGEDMTDDKVEKMVLPYMAVRMLTMEYESGMPLPPSAITPVLDYIESLSI